MKYTAHQKFIAELQAPVKKYRQKQEKKRKEQDTGQDPKEADLLDLCAIEEQLSAKFNALFGSCDEE